MNEYAAINIILDPVGNYKPQEGFLVVATDTEIVSAYPPGPKRLWAKGKRASEVCRRIAEESEISYATLRDAKDWLTELDVPEELQRTGVESLQAILCVHPPLDIQQASVCIERWLQERMPGLLRILDNADELASFLSDGFSETVRRVALIWLCRRKPGSPRHRVISRLLESNDPIATWFGFNTDSLSWINESTGFFPRSFPQPIEERIALYWRGVLVTTDGFNRAAMLVDKDVGALKRVIRREAQIVYDGLPPREKSRLEDLCRILFGDDWVLKHAGKDISWSPLSPVADINQMLEWFRAYREKADWGSLMSLDRVNAARSFQDWFLDRERFPRWCASGERGPLCFSVNTVIRDEVRTAPVLLLLVDALGYREHGELQRLIVEHAPTLRLTRDQVVLATLPTVTSVCKGSLLSGRPQREWQTASYKDMLSKCRRVSSRSYYHDHFAVGAIIEQLKDSQTSLVAVNYNDLDRTFHDATDAATIPGLVAGKLSELAMHLSQIAFDLSGELECFSVVVVSDHGQVVGPCRTASPEGEVVMQRLRRASGPVRPAEILLNREQTLCTDDYYAITDDTAWSSSPNPLFGCHGGIFPEEVITRLTAYSFQPRSIVIHIEGSGAGVAGVNGTISWCIKNLSAINITIRTVKLTWDDREFPLPTPPGSLVTAFSSRTFLNEAIDGWPNQIEITSIKLEIEYVSHAGGNPFLTSGNIRIESELGYQVSPFEF